MIKSFIANIPFFLAVPIELVVKLLSYVVDKLVYLGGTLHIKLKTPTGIKLKQAEEQLLALKETARQLKALSEKSAAKNNINSNNRLVNLIGNGGKSDPTFH